MDRPLASGALVLVDFRVVDEVPLVEPAFGLAVRGERLGNQRNDARLLTCKNFRGIEVATVGQRCDALCASASRAFFAIVES
jgi:hypothetical protein